MTILRYLKLRQANNITTVYKYWYFIVATCFRFIRQSSGQHSEIWCTISVYHVLWDPILLTGCT